MISTQSDAIKAKKKFLKFFKQGFYDPQYLAWERDYKHKLHLQWNEQLNKQKFKQLLKEKKYLTIAKLVTQIESRSNLLFSFEKMALRDAVKSQKGAKIFSEALFNFLYANKENAKKRFELFVTEITKLPRKQSRVLTWPLVTVFAMIADPKKHIFIKPNVTKTAAKIYGFDFAYRSRPNWETYQSMLKFAERCKIDLSDLKPRDYIDLQSFIWVLGSDEYI